MTIANAAATIVATGSKAVITKPDLFASVVLNIGRGGAATAVKTLASAALLQASPNLCKTKEECDERLIQSVPRGGGKKEVKDESRLTPQGSSVLCMAIAMSLHYLSYSIARPSTIALFTSAKTGFAGNKAAFPFAMAFISPASLGLLLLYGKILGAAGPRGAIRQTTFLVAAVLWASASLVYLLSDVIDTSIMIPLFGIAKIPLLQALVGALFIFRESYVQLLTSQYWSFMASILTPDQSAKWFSPISGLTSITSAFAGLGVRRVVKSVGLPGALGK